MASEAKPLLQIAPMMDVTYRDMRYFMRLLTRRAQLWTEMVVDDTILHNLEPARCDNFLGYDPVEHPIVCQLGGSSVEKLGEVAQVVERYGYDEINLNVGCPSNKVSNGEFGCSLMKRKELVRDIVHEMNRRVQIPVTVKCRLGVDDLDSQQFTKDFVSTVAPGGCKHFYVHARKAWLKGLSPHQNRMVPPLQYGRVRDLCESFPDLQFSINGGIGDLGHARALLGFPGARLDGETDELVGTAWDTPGQNGVPPNFVGVMIGRGAMNSPAMLWDVDHAIYGDERPGRMTRRILLDKYRTYLEDRYPAGEVRPVGVVHNAIKPILGIFSGKQGHRAFRAYLDGTMRDKEVREKGPAHVLEDAMRNVDAHNPGVLDELADPTTAFRPKAAVQPAEGRKAKRLRALSCDTAGSCAAAPDACEQAVPCTAVTECEPKPVAAS